MVQPIQLKNKEALKQKALELVKTRYPNSEVRYLGSEPDYILIRNILCYSKFYKALVKGQEEFTVPVYNDEKMHYAEALFILT